MESTEFEQAVETAVAFRVDMREHLVEIGHEFLPVSEFTVNHGTFAAATLRACCLRHPI